MSCNTNNQKVSKIAGWFGVNRLSNKVASIAKSNEIGWVMISAGIGASTVAITRKVLLVNATRRNKKVLQTIAMLQEAASLGFQALEAPEAEESTRLAQQARGVVVKLAKRDILPLKNTKLKGALVHFAGDILKATDIEQLDRPGNVAWLNQAKRILRGSQLVYLPASDRPGWKAPLITGGVVGGAAVAGAVWLAGENKRQSKKYLSTLQKFYASEKFDFEASMRLTGAFGNSQADLPDLRRSLGRDSKARPLTKQGGEDDIFLLEGTRGHIHYLSVDGKRAQILAVIPGRGREAQLSGALKQAVQSETKPDPAEGSQQETTNHFQTYRKQTDDSEVTLDRVKLVA